MLLNFLLYRPARSSCLSSLLGHMVSSTLPKGPTPSIARETPVVQPMPEKPSNVIILDLPALWRQDGENDHRLAEGAVPAPRSSGRWSLR
ncbi:hypothetical protein [Sinorhizobium meliloti]|nr:hypothetical protein [Sinorhizobium meliloti]MDW9415096.1 hypothetical protein [Sinorhizobium meliloti]MDW9479969.1 hypothetical protein [Sinorhizobium meliloti]MDW9510044.1 hypothetical protein [Sinorhizobium meliloti]MDW9634622.1 hypothetical protein [Sinorhizobium meliloti]MDW9810647.1 hypothetical protein [Sinorhizobium meliloti]